MFPYVLPIAFLPLFQLIGHPIFSNCMILLYPIPARASFGSNINKYYIYVYIYRYILTGLLKTVTRL